MAQETILVVDADQKSQKLLEVSFKKEEYVVLVTDTIKDAIKTIGAKRPDLIICDTNLPDGDGFTLCEQLKLNPKFASIPFLFLTEDDALARKMRAFELGAAEYLQKPIFIKDVTSRVKLQLQERNKSRLHDAADEELITGSLDDITVIDLLQTIESRDRSGVLELEREEGVDAMVSFHQGNILDAECGPLRGEEALYRLMLWPKGSFRLEYKEVKSADHIEKDSGALLIEGMRRFESWNDMVQTLPHLSRVFRAVEDAMEASLPQEVRHLVDLFDGSHTLRRVVDESPVDDLTTLRIIRKLLDEGLLEDVTQSQDLRQSAQHTNLASWLSGHTTVRPEEEGETPRRRTKVVRAQGRGGAHLFDTTPGFKSVPGLNADSIVESDEEIAEVARSIEEVSSPQSSLEESTSPLGSPFVQAEERSLEEGSAPIQGGGDGEDVTHWRFHWDREAGQAVATPRQRPEDPFALDELEQDLQRIEQRRREEEARRIAAERAFEQEDRLTTTTLDPARPALKAREESKAPKEPTKELHRESVLAEVEKRKKEQGDEQESLADMVAKDYASEDERYTSRQRTDQFIPVFEPAKEEPKKEEPVSQDEIETAEIPRTEEGEASTEEDAVAATTPLVPLGADISEPIVSEEEAKALKSGGVATFEEEETDEEERELDEASDAVEGDEDDEGDEDVDIDLEEISAPAKSAQAEDIIAHRTPRNQELVHAEVELKRGSDEVVEEDEATLAAPAAGLEEESDDEAALTSGLEGDEADLAAEEPAPKVIVAPTLADEKEEDKEPVVVHTPGEPKEEPAGEDEEEGYLLDAPLFADEDDEGFNTAGLLAVGAVILAVIGLVVFVLNDDEPKPGVDTKDPVVAVVDLGEPDTGAQQEDLSALAQAEEPDAAPDALDMMELAALTIDQAPGAGLGAAQRTHAQTASLILAQRNMDLSTIDDPVAALAALEVTDAQGEANTPDAGLDTRASQGGGEEEPLVTNTTTKPAEPKPSAETLDERIKEVAGLVRRERYKRALKPARKLAKEAPDNGQVAALLGSAELNGGGSTSAAIKQFERAQKLGYRSSTMYLDMATAYTLSRNNAKAKSTYERFLKSYPKHKKAGEVRSILNNQY